ncbi:MAG TPA: Tex family protein [Thermoanaerobaculia bacterium]|nr:Tex family protein [Thermoanaerobaculia bacterium]
MSKTAVLEPRFIDIIASEVGCRPHQVGAAAALFAEGATVPFVARYRKEATGGLEDLQLETLAKRREYFLELTERRDAILESIREQGKLTDELEASLRAALTKQELEDLYLPYKPKRRTRAQIAREKGLEPLADAVLSGAHTRELPEELARPFVDAEKGVEDAAAALAGARDILAERLAENAERRAELRKVLATEGVLRVRVLPGKESDPEAATYRDYFEHDEPGRDIPSHRLLAILRGEREGFLLSDLRIDDDREVESLSRSWSVPVETPCGRQVAEATADSYKRLLRPSLTNEVRGEMRERAEMQAIGVFRANLESLLLQAPLGQVPVMGLDPGFRTGCKLAVVDGTGRVVATEVIHPVMPHADEAGATRIILRLVEKHGVHAIAIGNGTASRETEAVVRKVIQEAPDEKLRKTVVAIVPETGASVYSASAVAREELPQLDVTLRGAASIARRLQDPLAELVKIEPRSLGVGQYQHDVDQKSLERELDTAVEGAVNRVGVELNTASASLLRRVSGLSERLARTIVEFRDANGPFSSRQSLRKVSGFGPKTFELSAGFLRVRGGDHPLDNTAVHPERYETVEKMAGALHVPLPDLVGSKDLVSRLDFSRFRDEAHGLGSFTLEDIKTELLRPGRDPRPEFKTPEWRADVTTIKDLEPGMVLEGRVSNVANFGAFVDIGVHRDGLVHVSELTHNWIADPREAVKVGEIVKVKVIEVDHQRERISLSIKALLPPPTTGRPAAGNAARGGGRPDRQGGGRPNVPPPSGPARPNPQPPRPAKPEATIEDLMRKFNRS